VGNGEAKENFGKGRDHRFEIDLQGSSSVH
jgi:hypothetical protein